MDVSCLEDILRYVVSGLVLIVDVEDDGSVVHVHHHCHQSTLGLREANATIGMTTT